MATTRNDDDPEALIATLASWASTQVGPVEVVADRSRRHRRAVVLEFEGPRARRWFVKWPKSQHCFRREVRAYRRFVPILAGSAPRLVAADETRRALLLTVLPGRLAEHEDLQARSDVHRQAGVWLADLHGLSTPISDPGLGRKLGERLQRVCARARDLLDDSALEYVTYVGTRLDQMTGLSVVTCHLDYTQRNWVVDDGGRLGVIDFSTCGGAPVAEDLSRLAHRQWTTRPDLRDAFFAGYGRALDDDERAQLECSTALAALSDLASASALGRQALVAPAQRTLRHLRENSDLSPPTRATSRVRRSQG